MDLGTVAFVGSVLLAIRTFGLRERFESEETASAYSVFNRSGKSIVGGFTAEQFDKQMRGGVAPAVNEANGIVTAGSPRHSVTRNSRIQNMTEDERIRRRSASAAAAESRSSQQKGAMFAKNII